METPMLDFFARANSKDWRVIAYIVDVNDNKRSPIELTSIEIEFIRQQRLEISKKELQEQKDFLDNRYRDVIKLHRQLKLLHKCITSNNEVVGRWNIDDVILFILNVYYITILCCKFENG